MLKKKEMYELVSLAKAGDQAARHWLIESLRPMVRRQAMNIFGDREVTDDMLQEGAVAMIRAVDDFLGLGGADFRSYVKHRVRGYILNYLDREDKSAFAEPLVVDVVDPSQSASDYPDSDLPRLDCLTDRQREIVRCRYGLAAASPRKFKDIAKDLGISTRRCKEIFRAAMWRLRAVAEIEKMSV